MHPEIENKVREYARSYLITQIEDKGMFCKAAESRVISFDDIYLMGMYSGAESVVEGKMVELGEIKSRTIKTDYGKIDILVTDSIGHRKELETQTSGLLSKILKINKNEILSKVDDIISKVIDYHNEKRKNRKKS